ncbi:hypothetical protein [Halomonas sp. H2]|uniref:hypothetical protein n=1 Tax=Halomonas sp. H2 TaxID=261936 RepID=UPI003CF35EBC
MEIYVSIEEFLLKKKRGASKAAVFKDGVLFPFEYKLSEESDGIVFFLPGAFDRKNSMPKFQRSSYFSSLNCNCISFFDPTLFLTDDDKFTRAWFVGDDKNWYVNHIAHIVSSIVVSKEIRNSKILFFGSSAGGIPSIHLASRFSDSHAYCCNIQTNILAHYPAYLSRLVKVCFGEKAELSEVKRKYTERLDVTGLDARFSLHIVQNKNDVFHYKNHFLPYMDSLKRSSSVAYEYCVYDDQSNGHNPLPKDKEIDVINQILSVGTFSPCFEGGVSAKGL